MVFMQRLLFGSGGMMASKPLRWLEALLVFAVIFAAAVPGSPGAVYADEAHVVAGAEQSLSAASTTDFKGFPIVAYTPETSLTFAGFGLMLMRPGLEEPEGRTSSVLAAGAYTLNGQWLLNLSPDLYLNAGAYNIKSSLSLINWPSSFFGLGAQTRHSDEQRFDSMALVLNTQVRRRLWSPNLYLGLEYEFARRSVQALEAGMLTGDQIVGSRGGSLSAVGLNFAWDTRDVGFAASQGTYVQASVLAFVPALGSDYAYLRYKLDARQYVALGHQQVLAVQGLWESHVGEVPFYKLAKLGGEKRLRGLFKGRYRDTDMLLAQAEYRSPPWWRLRLAGFAGLGSVYGASSQLSIEHLKWSTGLGLRLAVDESEGVNVRADVGLSADGPGLYLSIGEAF
jgi:hypothetical protein